MTKHKRSTRIITLILLGLLSLVLLIFAFIAISSLTGREKIQVNDLERHYRIYVPSSYSEKEPVALVMVFHMLKASGKTMEWLTHFNTIAD